MGGSHRARGSGKRLRHSNRCSTTASRFPNRGDTLMHRYAWFFLAVLPGTTAVAADWPQWQGPDRNAVSKETGLLKEWPKDGPPLAWKVKDLGGGYGAPSVAAGHIFGMSNRGNDEVVWALDEKNGKELWVARL